MKIVNVFSESEDDEEFAEALDVDVVMMGDETRRLAETWSRKYGAKDGKDDDESGSCHDSDDSREHFSYQEDDSDGKSEL